MYHFVVNAKSGRGRGNKVLKKLCDYCYRKGIPFSAHITGACGHAIKLTQKLCESGAKTIIAVGGDGTFSEVLSGITCLEQTALGFIPAGRGNDYAKSAGLSLDPIKAFLDIINGGIVRVDYIEIDGRRCLNVAGTGLDVDVLKRVYGKTGKLSYLTSLVHCLKHFKPYKLKITTDGKTREEDCFVVAICNGQAYGGGIYISPRSKIDDGRMDVVVLTQPKDNKLMRALFKVKRKKHLEQEYTTVFSCDEITVEAADQTKNYPIQIDGEIFEDKILSCKVVKGGLRTFFGNS